MIIRTAIIDDEKNIFYLSNEPEIRNNSFNSTPITLFEHRRWFRRQIEDNQLLYLVAYLGDILVGQIRFKVESSTAIISVSVKSGFRGQGYGSKIMKHALPLCKEAFNINQVKAIVKKDNKKSRRFFESNGFKYHKELIYKGKTAVAYQLNL